MRRRGQVGWGQVNGTIEVTPEALVFSTGAGPPIPADPPPGLRVSGLLVGRVLVRNVTHDRWDPIYTGWAWRAVRRDLAANGWACT